MKESPQSNVDSDLFGSYRWLFGIADLALILAAEVHRSFRPPIYRYASLMR